MRTERPRWGILGKNQSQQGPDQVGTEDHIVNIIPNMIESHWRIERETETERQRQAD